jgi:hypothetical protein
MSDSVVELLHNEITNTSDIYFAARSVTANLGYCYSNSKSFDQMKSSGLLRYISPKKLLDSIGAYYVSFQWLANQSELLRLKMDAIHKGNAVLFDSYVFQQMMSMGVSAFGGKHLVINRPKEKPILLSTDLRDINTVSLNYHYYSSTIKFYQRTAIVQWQRAARLIEMIKNEYHFD